MGCTISAVSSCYLFLACCDAGAGVICILLLVGLVIETVSGRDAGLA
jgi:hypothetical protein